VKGDWYIRNGYIQLILIVVVNPRSLRLPSLREKNFRKTQIIFLGCKKTRGDLIPKISSGEIAVGN
jgi:hypothetical protein